MTTIELACPNCEAALTVDSAFAGGVCRCASCGSMIDVDVAVGASTHSGTAQENRPRSPATPVRRPARPRQTTRGKHHTRILSLVLTALITGTAVLLVVMARKRGGEQEPISPSGAEARIEALGYDSDSNPFKTTGANLLGLPLQDHTAVVVDTSRTGQPWLPIFREVLQLVHAQKKVPNSCILIIAREQRPLPVPTAWRDLGTGDFDGLSAGGLADLAPAMQVATDAGANHIILVASRSVFADEIAAIADVLAPIADGPIFHLVEIDAQGDTDLADFARQQGGTARRLSTNRITQWLAEAGG